MGHQISAIVCKPSSSIERVKEYDLPILQSGDFVIIPMDASHSDHWTEKLELGFDSTGSSVILDGRFARYIGDLAAEKNYALIETDYFGGAGDQAAVVYLRGESAPTYESGRLSSGTINEALRRIGVEAHNGGDKFDSIGLSKYRDFEDYFEKYYD